MDHEALSRHFTEGLGSHFLLLGRLLEGAFNYNHHQAPPAEGRVGQNLSRLEAESEAHRWALSTHYRQMRELESQVTTVVNTSANLATGVHQVSATNAAHVQEMSALRNRVEQLEATVAQQDVNFNVLVQFIGTILRSPHHSTRDGAGDGLNN